MTWWDGRLYGFDCETTGVHVEEDRIVSAAVVMAGGGLETDTLATMIDPGVPIPEEAAKVHGITTERARAEGKPARDVLLIVRGLLADAIEQGYPLIVMNAPFDLTLLDRELRRHDLEPLPAPLVVDPMVLDRFLDRFRPGRRNLTALCKHHGITLGDDAHDAAADAMAAVRLAWKLCARGQVIRRTRNLREGAELAGLIKWWNEVRTDLGKLHEFQTAIAREQAEGLARHFAEHPEKGVDPASVRTEWPVCPVREDVTT